MASPLDFGLLSGRFSFIFPLLLVFALVYGILTFTKPFKENRGVYSLIALVFALMTLFSPIARLSINKMAPWFVLLVVCAVFFLIILKMFNISDTDISGVLKSNKYDYLNFWIFGIIALIVIGSIVSAVSDIGGIGADGSSVRNASLEDREGDIDSANQESAFWATITHPKVLGLALLLLIGAATVQRMSSAP